MASRQPLKTLQRRVIAVTMQRRTLFMHVITGKGRIQDTSLYPEADCCLFTSHKDVCPLEPFLKFDWTTCCDLKDGPHHQAQRPAGSQLISLLSNPPDSQ